MNLLSVGRSLVGGSRRVWTNSSSSEAAIIASTRHQHDRHAGLAVIRNLLDKLCDRPAAVNRPQSAPLAMPSCPPNWSPSSSSSGSDSSDSSSAASGSFCSHSSTNGSDSDCIDSDSDRPRAAVANLDGRHLDILCEEEGSEAQFI